MKAASKYILKYFVVGVVTCLSLLLLSCPVKAATSDNFAGHWYVWEENINVSGNQWISYQNVLIVTNDPLAMGQVQVNNTTSGPNNFVQTLDFSGTYTFYSHRFEQPFTLSNGLMPVATSNGRAFTSYTPIQSSNNIEIVELSSSQINSLISSIQASGSYDDTDLLNQLAIINGVLDNIDTSSGATASSVAALNTTATSILTALNNLDNALDMISWNVYNITPTGYDSNFNVVDLSQTYLPKGTYYISYPFPTNYLTLGIIEKAFGYYNTFNQIVYTPEMHIGILRPVDGQLTFTEYGSIVSLDGNSYGRHNVLFDIKEGVNSNNYSVCIKVTFKYNCRISDSVTLKLIGHDDIEYWQIKSVMLQILQQQSDTSAIDNENENLSDQVDDYIEQENQLIGGFDNAMTNPAVIPTSNPDANIGSWGQNFISSLSLFSVLVGNVVGTSLTQWGNPIYLLLNFSLVFGFALLIIGKRG